MNGPNFLIIVIIFYICVAAGTAWHAFIIKRSSVFEPIGHYIFFLSLFTLPLPVRALVTMEIEGNVTPYLPDIVGYFPAAVALSAISLPLFSLGYYSQAASTLARRIPSPPETAREHFFLSAAALGGLAIFLLSLLAADVGGLLNLLLLGYGSSAALVGHGHLAIGFPLAFTASLMLALAYARKRSRARLLISLLALAGIVFIQAITGNRAQLLYSCLALTTLYSYSIKKIKLRTVLVCSLAGFLALNFLGIARNSSYANVGEFFDATLNAAVTVQESGGQDLFYTLTIGQFVVPFETLPLIMRTVEHEQQFWFGLSYIRAPLFLIPSAIYAERPLPLSNWYMEEFYNSGEALNEGRQFFFLAEAYLNFGALGVAALSLIWGMCWGALQRWMELSKSLGAILIHAVLTAFMFRCIAGDSVTLLAGVAQQALAPVILGIVILTGFRRWRSHHTRRRLAAHQASV